MSEFHSFLRLNNIRACVFVCSLVDGHFGCFHIVAIVSNGVTNMGAYSEVEFLDHIFILFFIV